MINTTRKERLALAATPDGRRWLARMVVDEACYELGLRRGMGLAVLRELATCAAHAYACQRGWNGCSVRLELGPPRKFVVGPLAKESAS